MQKKPFKLLLSLTVIVLTWMLVVPILEFPDEQAHFETVTFLAEKGRVPVGSENNMSQEMYQAQKLLGVFRNPLGQNRYTYHPEYNVEYTNGLDGKYESEILSFNTEEFRSTYVAKEAAEYPPLYYNFMSFFTGLVNAKDLITRLFVTRLGGLLIAFAYGYTAWLIGLEVFKDKSVSLLLPVIALLQPMMSFVTAGINPDNLHNLFFAALIYLSLRMIKAGLLPKYLVGIAAFLLADIYTKPQGFIAIPVIGIAVLISLIRHKSWKALYWLIGLGLLAFFGTFNQLRTYLGLFNVVNDSGASFIEYLRFAGNKLIAQNVVWYWGVFKWLGVVLPPLYWRVANRVVLVSALGLLVYFYRALKKKPLVADLGSIIFILLTSLIYALVIFWYDWQYLKIEGFSLGVQARYFFPTLVAHLGLLITGILSLGWNDLARLWLKRGIVLLFAWLQLGGLWRLLTSYYATNPLPSLINQVSQYKPFFAKGEWWYLWALLYLFAFLYLLWQSLKTSRR